MEVVVIKRRWMSLPTCAAISAGVAGSRAIR